MNEPTLRVAGAMSGTSVDGIDVAIADIRGAPEAPGRPGNLSIHQIAFETVPWPAAERELIFDLFADRAAPSVVCRANFLLGERFAVAVQAVLAGAGLPPQAIDLIGCHGQTIWHDVVDGRVTSTLQLGEPAVIAARTGITTVGNLRVADVAVGGHGAPLASTFDWHFLRPAANLNGVTGGWRAVQNIGGIGNVTFLPPQGSAAPPLAFDTGPGNALIDWAAGEATDGAWTYDRDGALAARGTILPPLVDAWLAHPYFAASPPKTTGRELFGVDLARQWQREVLAAGGTAVDGVATLTELTAASIADSYVRFAPGPVAQVVVAGGGAANPILMGALRRQLTRRLGRAIEVIDHTPLGIDAGAKEGLLFALLAYLCVHGWPGNVPACTGARTPVILGQITPGANYGELQRKLNRHRPS